MFNNSQSKLFSAEKVTFADFGNPVQALWFSCS